MHQKNGTLNLKILRQNFIKKHQFDQNYFSCQTEAQKMYLDQAQIFSDRDIFYPKQHESKGFKRIHDDEQKVKQDKNKKNITQASKQYFQDQRQSKGNPIQKQIVPISSDYPRIVSPKLRGVSIGAIKQISSTLNNRPFLKAAETIKRRIMSAGIQKGRCERYSKQAQYLKGPCSVQPVKLSSRPQTSLTKRRSGFFGKKVETKIKVNKYEFFQPWQITDEFQEY